MKGPRKVDIMELATRPCPCCGQPTDRTAPHTPREDFEHFLAYSGWAGEDEATKEKLWKAWQHARSPKLVEELIIDVQGQDGGPPSAVEFWDPYGARVELGPWEPREFGRWQLRLPLRPLVRTYAPEETSTPPKGR